MVRTSGSNGKRLALVTASARNRPSATSGSAPSTAHDYLVAKEARHSVRQALIGHMDNIGAGLRLEPFRDEMRRIAVTRGAIIELAGIGLGLRDEFADRARRERRIDDQQLGTVGYFGDGDKIPRRVVVAVSRHSRQHRKRAHIAEQQRVAVGFGIGDRLGADHAAAADAVLDDHVLLERGRHVLRHQARHDIDRSAVNGTTILMRRSG
jgi:hypothetical protein